MAYDLVTALQRLSKDNAGFLGFVRRIPVAGASCLDHVFSRSVLGASRWLCWAHHPQRCGSFVGTVRPHGSATAMVGHFCLQPVRSAEHSPSVADRS